MKKITLKNSTYSGSANGFIRGRRSVLARVLTAENIVNNVIPKIPVLNVANTSSTFSVRTATSAGVIKHEFQKLRFRN